MSLIEKIEAPIPFPLGSVSCYYIQDSVPTLIDTGVNAPDTLEALQGGIAKRGGSLSGVGRIILTHVHSDHAGAAGKIAAISGASVFVHCWDKDKLFLGSEEAYPENESLFLGFFHEAGVPAEMAKETTAFVLNRFKKNLGPIPDMELLEGGEIFSFDSFELKVIHTPGHTAGSICLYNQQDGSLFSGDSLLRCVTPNVVAELQSPEGVTRYDGLQLHSDSMELLDTLPVGTILPGHGNLFGGHQQRIEQLRQHRRRRCKKVLEALRSGMNRYGSGRGMSLYEAAGLIFPPASLKELFLCLSDAQGYLEMLRKEGLVAAYMINGQKLYRLNDGQHDKGEMQ